jgi:hypothetical protein
MKGAYPRLGTGARTHEPEPERDNWIVTTGQRALRRPFEEGGRENTLAGQGSRYFRGGRSPAEDLHGREVGSGWKRLGRWQLQLR